MKIYHQNDCLHFPRIAERLNKLGVEYEAVNLVDQVPTVQELGRLLMAKNWHTREICNFDSSVYRRLDLDSLVFDMDIEELFTLLQSNGRLIASPLVIVDSDCYAPVREDFDLKEILDVRSEAA